MPRPSLWPAFLFLLLGLPVLLFLALTVPTGEVPDEVAHIVRMDSLLHGAIVGHRGTRLDGAGNTVPDSGVTANPGLIAPGFSFKPGTPLPDRVLSRARLAQLEALPWAPQSGYVSVPNTAVYPPLFYVPGAIGMGIARLLGYGPWDSIIAARLASALAYLGLGVAALVLARRLRGVLLAVLLLPMSLWLGMSCNQDGLIIAAAVLGAALMTRATVAAWWWGALTISAVVMAKPPYLPLALAVAALLPERRTLLPLRAAGALLAAAPGVVWFVVARAAAAVPFVRGAPYHGGPHWFGDPARLFTVVDPSVQLQVLLHDPALLIQLPLQAMWDQGGWLTWQAVGLLAILDVLLPAWLYLLWLWGFAALLAGEGFAARRETAGPGWLAGLLVVGAVIAAVFAVFDGQYLSWTHTGSAAIEGVQGRYFIPLLPILSLAIPTVRIGGAIVLRQIFRLPALAAACAGLVVIPGLVVATYYLH